MATSQESIVVKLLISSGVRSRNRSGLGALLKWLSGSVAQWLKSPGSFKGNFQDQETDLVSDYIHNFIFHAVELLLEQCTLKYVQSFDITDSC